MELELGLGLNGVTLSLNLERFLRDLLKRYLRKLMQSIRFRDHANRKITSLKILVTHLTQQSLINF